MKRRRLARAIVSVSIILLTISATTCGMFRVHWSPAYSMDKDIVSQIVQPSTSTSSPPDSMMASHPPLFDSSSPEPTVEPHVHEYTEEIIEPLCESPGALIYRCMCGDEYQEPIDAFGHSYTVSKVTHATCGKCGTVEYACEQCGKSYVIETEPPLTHIFELVDTIASTCVQLGKNVYQCTLCGEQKTEDTELAPHVYNTVIETKEPTCAKEGYVIKACACGATEKTSLPKTKTHSYQSAVYKQATATGTGILRYTCKVCGKHYDEPIPKLKVKLNLSKRRMCNLYSHLDAKTQAVIKQIMNEWKPLYEDDNSAYLFIESPYVIKDYEDVYPIMFSMAYAMTLDQEQIHPVMPIPKPESPTARVYVGGDVSYAIPANGLLYVCLADFAKMVELCEANYQRCRDVLSTFYDGTDMEIVQQSFSWLDKNVAYDSNCPDVKDIFLKHRGSCNAKSTFVRTCCALCGIQCDIIVGFTDTGGYHAWNRIMIDGKWTYWDATMSTYRNRTSSIHHPKCINYRTLMEDMCAQPDLQL